MYYTVKYAYSLINCDMQVDFNKSGNKYIISAWSKTEHKTIKRFEYSRYEEAENAFDFLRKEYGLPYVKEIEQEWSASDFD